MYKPKTHNGVSVCVCVCNNRMKYAVTEDGSFLLANCPQEN